MAIQINFDVLDLNDYENILKSIDATLLRTIFLESCKKLDSKSKYYLGKKFNGKFWNGFRVSSIAPEKIIKSILDDIKKKSKDMDYKSFIETVVNKQFNIKTNDINKIKENILKINKIKSIESLFKFLNISDINQEEFDAIKIKTLKDEYENKIIKIQKELNETFATRELFLKKENEKLKKENNNLNKLNADNTAKLNKEVVSIKKNYNDLLLSSKLKDEELSRVKKELENDENHIEYLHNKIFSIFDENIKKTVLDYFLKKNFESKDQVKQEIKKLINDLNDNIEYDNFNQVILELYILNQILEG